MDEKDVLIDQAEILFDQLEKECVHSSRVAELRILKNRLYGLCAETADDKSSVFEESRKALDALESDYPGSKDTIGAIRALLESGSAIECGGP